MTPTRIPDLVRDHMASVASESIDRNRGAHVAGDVARREARLRAMRTYVEDVRTARGGPSVEGKMAAKGTSILIDAAEDLAHGAAGELTDAGIAAAERKAGCVCQPAVVQTLRALWDVAIAAAFAGVRRAAR